MSMKDFRGTIPALITPFDRDGNVDAPKFRHFLDWLVPQVSGLYVGGSYGSGPIMTVDQRKQAIEIVAENVNGRIPVILHAGDPDTYTTIELARHAEGLNVSAIASLTPYYYLHGAAEVDTHFLRLIDAVSIPVYLYNNPKYTSYCVTAEQIAGLAAQGLAGIKDSSANIQLFYSLVAATSGFGDFHVLVGSQTILLPALVGGGRGCISGLSNLYPKVVNGIFEAAVKGDFAGGARGSSARQTSSASSPVRESRYRSTTPPFDIGVSTSVFPSSPCCPRARKKKPPSSRRSTGTSTSNRRRIGVAGVPGRNRHGSTVSKSGMTTGRTSRQFQILLRARAP